jgi:hypothetical protein
MTDLKNSGRDGSFSDVAPSDAARVPVVTPRQYRIVVPYTGDWMTANNAKLDKYVQGARRKAWRDSAYYAARGVKPKLPTRLQLVRLDVLYRWAKPPVDTARNMEPTLKAIVDGALGPRRGTAVGYGLIVDDNAKHLVYGEIASEVATFPRAKVAMDAYFGDVVLTVTDLSDRAA